MLFMLTRFWHKKDGCVGGGGVDAHAFIANVECVGKTLFTRTRLQHN